MEHSELFLLLPKYEEVTEQPDYIQSKGVMTEDEILKVVESIEEICSFIANENYKGYYDADNVYAFLYSVKILEECYPKTMTLMRRVMSKWGENWRMQKIQKDTETYMYYCLPIKDDTLCEITERKSVSADASTFLLVNLDAFKCSTEFIRTKRNQNEIELDVINFDIKSLSKWFEVNRKPQRIFNLNPKHGENGRGAHPSNNGYKVSVLMCSKEEAKQMLYKAIGDDLKTLYYFDQKNQQYIEFKCEKECVYHGFHLDADDERRVPPHIRIIIHKLTQSY